MRELSHDDELTDGARSVFDDYVRSYAESILRSARSRAVRSSVAGNLEVSVRDMVEAIEETTGPAYSPSYSRRRRERLRLILSLYALAGLAMTATGLMYYITAQNDLTSAERIGLLVAATGFLLTLFSGGVAGVMQRRVAGAEYAERTRLDDLAGEFIREWANFEAVASRLVAETAGESRVDAVPLRELLRLSDKYDFVSSRDRDFLREMLDTRNRVVHSNAPFRGPQARDDLERLRSIVARLSTKIHP